MRVAWLTALALAFLLLVLPSTGMGARPLSHYLPIAGDRIGYSETVTVTNGMGNYSGYSDLGQYSGSLAVTSIAANGTANATYQSSGTFTSSLGVNRPWSQSGTFAFSPSSFLYVRGTDNQTGYVNPKVWFFMDASLGRGAVFESLNTPMSVVSTNYSFPDSASSTGYVATIFAEGNGTYARSDAYGNFAASYNWKEYFDTRTGYVVGYVDSETDIDGAGDGFTYTDTITDTSTSFALTPATAPPRPPGSSGASGNFVSTIGLLVVVVLAVVIVVVVVAVVAMRRGGRRSLPQHATAPMQHTMPSYAPPPPLNLIPGDQPSVQQVVVRETVKVPCRFCGTLIDSTATNCPKCGAPRT
ncbi:MAG TPA: zinc ribbon domain-containing protein [Thermoplasmata archaeon]|nr:zinc ribbon domain-containing protein [Thermoplasmata archaeon]